MLNPRMLIRFSPGTLFGDTNHHFGVIVSERGEGRNIGLVVGTTSNVKGLVSFASSREMDESTVVVIQGGSHAHFGKQTAFDCNRPEVISAQRLVGWYEQGLIEIPDNEPYIDEDLLVLLRSGVHASDMVEPKTKELLFC